MTPKSTAAPPRPRINVTVIAMLAVSLLWAGMLLGVSWLATPAKFLAPSLTLPVALDVGRHTFAVFNWVEIGWSLALLGLVLVRAPARWVYAVVAVPCGIVALETAWLLPVLDARVGVIIAGGTPPDSGLHTLYIMLEAAKLAALLALAFGSARHLVRAARPGAITPLPRAGRDHSRRTGPVSAPSGAAQVLRLGNRRSRP